MKVLLCLPHGGLFRNFDSTLRLLVERDHSVHVAFDSDKYRSAAFDALCTGAPNLTTGYTPRIPADRSSIPVDGLRATSDYMRYLDPEYASAPKLRARAERGVPRVVFPMVDFVERKGPAARQRLDRQLRIVERSVPVREEALAFLREQAPDLLVVSPLFGSRNQLELLRASRRLRIPAALCIASWDNLTNKGLIREIPDAVVVWNETQRYEAVSLHGIPDDRVRVTGAQNFDEWFDREPSTSRDGFCRQLGLRSDRPILLYLGSSGFVAPQEAAWVKRWLARLRAHPAPLSDSGVIIRPHPQNARQYGRVDFSDDDQVVVWPPPEAAPEQTGRADWSREDFYDSIYHAQAVVGVNTTAMIESAVLGRPVFTLLDRELDEGQSGTLHFKHLLTVSGGLLHVATSFEEHLAQLAQTLDNGADAEGRGRGFLEAFLRPHGLDAPATPVLVSTLEDVAARGCVDPDSKQRVMPRQVLELVGTLATLDRRRGRCAREPFARRLARKTADNLDEAADVLERVARQASGA